MEADLSRWKEFMKKSKVSNFPEEIVIDILTRLPVKSIVRFKCVCKGWCSLFSDKKFIESHLKQAFQDNKICFLLRHIPNSKEKVHYMWSNESLGRFDNLELAMQVKTNCYKIQNVRSGLICEGRSWEGEEIYLLRSGKNFEEIGKVEVPVKSKTKYYSVVESCNGLVCLTESNFNGSYHSFNIFLWNPATREFRAIPEFYTDQIFASLLTVVGIGFAFQPLINDYKVVRIIYFIPSDTYEVEVYSLNTDSWRKINLNIEIDCYIDNHVSQANINGALHWMVTNKGPFGHSCKSILSFDVNEEKFDQIGFPDFGYLDFEVIMERYLTVLWDSLAVFVYKPFKIGNYCDIWIMRDYYDEKSWDLFFSLQHVELMTPFGFFDNGNIIIEKKGAGGETSGESGDNELVTLDPFKKEIKSLGVCQPARIVKYVESLVSTKGGGGGGGGASSSSDACSSSDPCSSSKAPRTA